MICSGSSPINRSLPTPWLIKPGRTNTHLEVQLIAMKLKGQNSTVREIFLEETFPWIQSSIKPYWSHLIDTHFAVLYVWIGHADGALCFPSLPCFSPAHSLPIITCEPSVADPFVRQRGWCHLANYNPDAWSKRTRPKILQLLALESTSQPDEAIVLSGPLVSTLKDYQGIINCFVSNLIFTSCRNGPFLHADPNLQNAGPRLWVTNFDNPTSENTWTPHHWDHLAIDVKPSYGLP